MKILITGATGLIGSALVPRLTARGHQITPLSRKPKASASEASWNPETDEITLPRLPEFDAVIHLAGESIAQRWTSEAKKRIHNSRVQGTRLLCDTLAKLPTRPATLLCASAIGFFGDRGDELVDEESKPGKGFLADVCREWEAAAAPAKVSDIRVVYLRFGVVLSASGGGLKKMLPPFRLGLGGKIGDGKQFWSWIALSDAVSAIAATLENPAFQGPVNIVSPHPVRNVEFTRTLARTVHRPAFLPVPKFAVKLALGEMGEEALLSSIRVKPARLEQHGFRFDFPELSAALQNAL